LFAHTFKRELVQTDFFFLDCALLTDATQGVQAGVPSPLILLGAVLLDYGLEIA
jgi:hypothetical protein